MTSPLHSLIRPRPLVPRMVVGLLECLSLMICQALNLPECPQSGFFYTPTSYMVTNKEFVSDTIQKFYQASCSGQSCQTKVFTGAVLL